MNNKNAPHSEVELVSLLKTGHEPALAEIFRRYEAKLYVYALRFSKDRELTEEILQDVFVSLWEYREEINIEIPVSALLYKIIKNKLLNAIRQETRMQSRRKEYSTFMEISRDLTEEHVLLNDYHEMIDRAINSLPRQRRSIFRMNHEEGKSYDQIADALGISKNTVRKQMVKSIKYVRDFLKINLKLNVNAIVGFFYFLTLMR